MKKRQHLQLRALLFNRLGLFDLSHAEKNNRRKNELDPADDQQPNTTISSQQHLKGPGNNNSTNGGRQRRRGVIRFNSIVSVVGIPTRSQYSSSLRHLLWGKDSYSFGSDDDNPEGKDETMARTQDDPVKLEPASTERKSQRRDKPTGTSVTSSRKPRLMRKPSFRC